MTPQSKPDTDKIISAIAAIGTGVLLLYVPIFYFSFKIVKGPFDAYINISVLTLGVALGWMLGTFASPDSTKEGEKFSKYGAAVASFASGYLLSKVDKIVDKAINNQEAFNHINSFRFIAFVVGVLAALMVTYVLREYVLGQVEKETPSSQMTP